MFKPSKLRAYLLRAQEAGLDPDIILEGSGTSWADIEALQLLDLETISDLFDFVARRTPAGFAIRCGSVSKAREFGIVGFAMMSMPTLRAAFDHWNRYCLVAGHPLVTTVTEEGDEWSMHFKPRRLMSEAAQRFCIEASLAALELVIEELTGVAPCTLGIDFSFERPAVLDEYTTFQTQKFHFGRPTTTYHGKRTDLDRAIPARDSQISELFHRQCAEFLADLTNTRPLSEQLEDLMRESAGNTLSLDDLAGALGMSRRSLQRELHNQGVSYQQLVKRSRMQHALVLVGENRVNIKTIAFMVGFKNVGSFRRAFHEWTGQSAAEWQASRATGGQAGRPSRGQGERELRFA